MLSGITPGQIPGTPSPLRLAAPRSVPASRLERVRAAGAAFIRGTTQGWNRRELATWLVDQYAPCVTPPFHMETANLPPVMDTPLDEGFINRLILDARDRVLQLLAELVVPWEATPRARLAVACGAVAPERDERGAIAYYPVRLMRMRLAQRVSALFLADYLNRPTEYRWLMLCSECGELAFSAELAHGSWCEASPEEWIALTPAEALYAAAGSSG